MHLNPCYLDCRWQEAKRCFGTSPAQSLWGEVVVHTFIDKLLTDFKIKYRRSYESGSPDESHFSFTKSWADKLLDLDYHSLYPLSQWQPCNFLKLVQLHHEKDRRVMFFKQSPNIVNERESAPILEYRRKAIKCYLKAFIQHTDHDNYWIVLQVYKDLYYMLQFHNFALWIGSHGCTLSDYGIKFPDRLIKLWNQSLLTEGASMDSAVWQEIWK
jgi:hypothetical protein